MRYSRNNNLIVLNLFIALSLSISSKVNAQKLTSFVDPYIGSGGHGHVFVGASVPFGAVQIGPDNLYKGWDWCSGYNYADSILIGFAQTHLSGTGIGDLADILMMPYTGGVKLDKGVRVIKGLNGAKDHEQIEAGSYASRYSHATEKVRPGYYSVKLLDHNVDVELTASERVGFHQYHFPAGKEAHVIIDLKEGINDQTPDTYIKQVDPYTLEGYRKSRGWAKDQWIFFAIRSSEPLAKFAVYNNTQLLDGNSGQGSAIKGLISFDKAPATLKLKVGISPVSSENALDNINAEIPGWDFDSVAKQADAKWNKELSTIKVETSNLSDKRIFYTSLYHTMIDPAMFNDHNGDYRGTDRKVYKNAPFTNYSVFSLWDTYRAANPLYALTQPKRVGDMVNSMLAIYDQQGRLPIWHLMGNETGTMVGIGSMQVIAEAYLKGIKGFDAHRAFNAIKTTSNLDLLGLKYVKDFQYIPSNTIGSSTARGLEYAISDASTALMAKQLKKEDDYNYYLKRSKNYKLYFNPEDRFLRGRLADGTFPAKFSTFKSGGNEYSEGNAWQYLWLVPHDVKGLVGLLGGEKQFNNKLDSLFTVQSDIKGLDDLTGLIGQYAHGNEPSHHITYLYNFTGQQWKTAEKVRYVMKNFYLDNPDGIIGNEDCGQMSAWYVFSSLGFYPVFPASGKYVIGSPVVKKATLQTTSGKSFVVEAVNNNEQNIYIQKITLNGKSYPYSYITYTNMMKGGTMKIVMGSKPNYKFGAGTATRP